MKRFLVLALIYTLNIIMFLFAKSAGACDYRDKLSMIDRKPAIVTKLVVKR